MEEQKNWLQLEKEKLKENSFQGEVKPALKLSENKTATFTIDASEPFVEWDDKENKTIKKIIPIVMLDTDGKPNELVWWLNVKNPIYSTIIEKLTEGQTEFKVLQVGTKKDTKYVLVD